MHGRDLRRRTPPAPSLVPRSWSRKGRSPRALGGGDRGRQPCGRRRARRHHRRDAGAARALARLHRGRRRLHLARAGVRRSRAEVEDDTLRVEEAAREKGFRPRVRGRRGEALNPSARHDAAAWVRAPWTDRRGSLAASSRSLRARRAGERRHGPARSGPASRPLHRRGARLPKDTSTQGRLAQRGAHGWRPRARGRPGPRDALGKHRCNSESTPSRAPTSSAT